MLFSHIVSRSQTNFPNIEEEKAVCYYSRAFYALAGNLFEVSARNLIRLEYHVIWLSLAMVSFSTPTVDTSSDKLLHGRHSNYSYGALSNAKQKLRERSEEWTATWKLKAENREQTDRQRGGRSAWTKERIVVNPGVPFTMQKPSLTWPDGYFRAGCSIRSW